MRNDFFLLRDRLVDERLEPEGDILRPIDSRAGRELGRDGDLPLIGRRHQLDRNCGEDEECRDHRSGAQPHHGRPVKEGAVQEAAISLVDAVQRTLAHREQAARDPAALVGRGWQLQHPRAQHRHDRHRNEQRHQQREHDDDRQLLEHDARHAGQEEQRHEHGHVGQRRGQDGRPDFLGPLDGRLHAALARFHVPEGVLEHDDRGVDDHAHAERQPPERHRVQRVPAEIEQREGADDRDRDRDADDHCRANLPQEQEDDGHDQDAPQPRGFLHGRDRAADEDGTVVQDGEPDAGDFLIQPGDLLADAVRHPNGVLAGLLLHAHAHARPAVDAHQLPAVFRRVLHLRDVAQVHRYPLAGHHHQAAYVFQIPELSLVAHQVSQIALVDLPKGSVLVFRAEQGDDAVDGEVECGDLLFGELHVNLAAQAAVHGDRRHPCDPLEARCQFVFRQLTQRDAVEVPLDADAHNRHGIRIELEDLGRLRLLRQPTARAVDPVSHVVSRFVEVGAPDEVQRHAARALGGGGLQPLESRDRADGLFDGARDELLDLERPDAGVPDPDGQAGVLDVGHEIDRQPGQGDHPKQDHHRHDHEHRDGPVNG